MNARAPMPLSCIGYTVWQQQFGGRENVIGQTVQLGKTTTTIVGVMPEGFAFPINHRLWVPLQLRPAGYAPLEGPSIRVYGRVAPDATQAQANAELSTIVERAAKESPRTHERLRPRVLAYGGESPGDQTWLEFAIQHLPALLVLAVACMNVGTLIYARTATREAEIATRYALGAGRTRIVAQLFVEALVLASIAAAVGLARRRPGAAAGARASTTRDCQAARRSGSNPGLKLTTIVYAAAMTVAGATILGVLPALKVDVSARAHPAAHPGRRRLDAAIRRVLDRRDDRAGGDHGHLPAAGLWHLGGGAARSADPRSISRRALPGGASGC